MELNYVKVIFAETKHNYTTSVGPLATAESVKTYFVGQWFNLGTEEKENMQKCIDVKLTMNK